MSLRCESVVGKQTLGGLEVPRELSQRRVKLSPCGIRPEGKTQAPTSWKKKSPVYLQAMVLPEQGVCGGNIQGSSALASDSSSSP